MLLNLLQLLQSDDQTTYTDKVNYNFDQILSMGGGPIGPSGFQGIQGVPGTQGIQGFQGIPGMDGARWYVQNSFNIPVTPTPKLGDLWLQTDTLAIYEFLGSPPMWTNLGFNLAAPGVFTQVTNNVLFTSPNALRSLVLSPIDYLGLDSPGTNYKLKIIGSPSSPLLRFGVEDTPGVESGQAYQPFIAVQKNTSTNWTWIFDNSTANGDIFFGVNGNSLQIDAATLQSVYNSSTNTLQSNIVVSGFDLGSQVKLQNSPSERLLSFAVGNTGAEYFHLGRHTGLTTPADRFISIMDTGQISIGNAFATPSGSTTYHTDFLEADLAQTGPPPANNWLRLRGRTATSGTNYDMLTVTHNRLFNDTTGGPSNQSSMIKIQHDTNGSLAHFIGLTGGVDDATGTIWPQMRFGYANSYYMSGDQNGRVGIGSDTFIKRFNNVNTGNTFGSKLTIEGNPGSGGGGDTIIGGASFSGIHLIPQNFVNSQVGITAGGIGLGTNPLTTFAGLHFKDESNTVDQGLDLNIGTSVYSDGGEKTRITVQRYGDTNFWSKSSTTHSLFIEPGGRRDATIGTVYANNNVHIGSIDSNNWRSIILNAGTDTGSFFGQGFVGIGQYLGFGEDIVGTNTLGQLVAGQWYIGKVGPVVYNAVTYPVNIPFQATSTTALTSGTVALANPATKFHVNESVTFGTRDVMSSSATYAATVGSKSFTVGSRHTASSLRGIIIGGVGHTVSGNDGIIIGYNGSSSVNMVDANKVLLATATHISTLAPTAPLGGSLISTDYAAPATYRLTSAPMLKVSTNVTPPPFFIFGQRGDLGRTAVFEARTSGLNIVDVPAAIEFHVRNPNTSRQIGMVYGNYTESTSGGTVLQTGKMSIAALSHFYPVGSPTPTSGSIYEIANFSVANGLQFVPSNVSGFNLKPQICVEAAKTADADGDSLYISAGNANDILHGGTGVPTNGGNILIAPGQGFGGGIGGAITIGSGTGSPAGSGTSNVVIDSTKVETHATTSTEIHSGTNTAIYGDMKFLNNVSAGTSSSSGGYTNISSTFYAGGTYQSTIAAATYDRVLQFVTAGSPTINTVITAGLNESPPNSGGTFMILGRSQFYGSFNIHVPAGVLVYVEAGVPSPGSITLYIQELKFGRH